MPIPRHGHNFSGKRSRTYQSWADMKSRCLNPKCRIFKRYGGRGIRMWAPWKSFEIFLRDMGECPEGCTLDRIDVNGHYEPANCRWATIEVQQRNKRTNVYITINGETKILTDWLRIYGVGQGVYRYRINQGASPIEAITTPVIRGGHKVRFRK